MTRLFAAALVDILNPLFVISLALFVTIGYALSLIMPVTIEVWRALFWLTLLLPLAGLSLRVYRNWHREERSSIASSWRVMLPLVPLLVLTLHLYAEFSATPLQVLSHGDIHSGYVYQILYRETPLENVFLAGFPANYYWLYHAYLAVLVKISFLSMGLVSSLVLVVSILSGVLWVAEIILLLKLAKPRTIYLGCMALAVYSALNLTGILSLIAHVIQAGDLPDMSKIAAMRVMLLDGADKRLFEAIDKMLDFNSMALGMVAFIAVFHACVKMLKDRLDLLSLVLISAGGLVAAAMQQVVVLYIVVAILGALLLTAAYYALQRNNSLGAIRDIVREIIGTVSPLSLSTWFGISVLLALPMLKYINDISYSSQQSIKFGISGHNNIGMIVAAFALLLPFFFIQWFCVLKRENVQELYIQFCATLALALTSVLALPDWNQYKGVYCLAIVIAFPALFVVRRWQISETSCWRRIGWTIATIFIFLALSKVIYSGYFFVVGEIYGNYPDFEYNGIHIEYDNEVEQRRAAYYWIRDHTPVDSVVIYPLYAFKFSNTMHERAPYLKRLESFHVGSQQAYEQRVGEQERFYDESMAVDDYLQLLRKMESELPGRTLYAVVKDSEVSKQVMQGRGTELVFAHETEGANVYLLSPASEALVSGQAELESE